ncbi:hydroxyphenylacetyl-CoA thioesterase PaaI [Candidatus Bathyarchaeota archaeon]|nr:hydroxyphenylacetyl-CoA thioesterase PaaI [Candidatus Bathyarchaeota archaeon]
MKGKDIFRENLGIQIIEVKDGYAKLSLKITKDHTNSIGAAHGGVIFSLADCAFAEACNYGDNVAVAVQVSINYLKPAFEGDKLTAEAVRISDGKTLGLYHITISKPDKKIAVFSGLAFKTSN